jgi:hypothetical protein
MPQVELEFPIKPPAGNSTQAPVEIVYWYMLDPSVAAKMCPLRSAQKPSWIDLEPGRDDSVVTVPVEGSYE